MGWLVGLLVRATVTETEYPNIGLFKIRFNPIIEITFLTLYSRNQITLQDTTICIFGCAFFFSVSSVFGSITINGPLM